MAATAATGMVVAPLAAQSTDNRNTRASDSAPVLADAQPSSQPGTGRDRDDDDSRIVGLPAGIAALFAAAASAGTIAIVDDSDDSEDNDQSPGT